MNAIDLTANYAALWSRSRSNPAAGWTVYRTCPLSYAKLVASEHEAASARDSKPYRREWAVFPLDTNPNAEVLS